MDENFPIYGGKFLRSKGHKAFVVSETAEKIGCSDIYHIEKASKLGAIFITFDKDFKANSSLVARSSESAGVIVVSISMPRKKDVIRILSKTLNFLAKNQLKSGLCEVSQDKITLYE